MSKANAMLDILDRECSEATAMLLADICDLCHHPYDLTQEQLEEKCSECTIESDLAALLKKQRTVMSGRVMAIVAEEMHPAGEKTDAD